MAAVMPCRPRLRARYDAPTSSGLLPATRIVVLAADFRNGKAYSTARAAWKLPFHATITEPNAPVAVVGGAIMTARAHS